MKCQGFYFLLFSFSSFVFSFEKESVEEIENHYYWLQDRPGYVEGNPFKGILKFNFFPGIPFSNSESTEKIHKIIYEELKKIGHTKQSKLLIQTSEGQAFDFSSFSGGMSLIYEVRNVVSIDQKDLDVVRATLALEATVSVEKTKEKCRSYVWSANCFLHGNVERNLEDLTALSLQYLLKLFERSYLSVNKNKPIFNLVE